MGVKPATADGAGGRALFYLRTDLEHAREKWQRIPERMREALRRHNACVEACVGEAGGTVQTLGGEGALAVFWADARPLECAANIQAKVAQQDWQSIGRLDLRIAVHAGATSVATGAARLELDFGLTPAEARVAMALARGLPPPEIAARFGVKQATVRTQLKSIFFKSDCHSQPELVAKLLKLVRPDAQGCNIALSELDYGEIDCVERMAESAWPGQIVVSQAARICTEEPKGARFESLGTCRLQGLESPLELWTLHYPGAALSQFPPLRAAPAPARNLPSQTGALLGRDEDVDVLLPQLRQGGRFITIVGAGGVGKTRLAGHLASLLSHERAVVFVSLEHVRARDDFVSLLARALGFPFFGPASKDRQLLDYLQDKDYVLVLDSAEHIRTHAPFLQALARMRRLTVIAASRDLLGVDGETPYRLSGLPSPGLATDFREAPAARLFATAAQQARPEFAFNTEDAEIFDEICALLGGAPLALQLTAQWVRYFPLGEILQRLRESPDLLARMDAEPDARHQSYRGIFETTWALLQPAMQQGVAHLSIFNAGFDLEAAEAIASVSGVQLHALEFMGLVESIGARRFALHPLVLRYASEKLGARERETIIDAHARYYLGYLARTLADPGIEARRLGLDDVAREWANLKEAWFETVGKGGGNLSATAELLFLFVCMRSQYGEGDSLFDVATADAELNGHLRAMRAACLLHQGKWDAGRDLAEDVLKGEPYPTARAHAEQTLGNFVHFRGDMDAAIAHYTIALDLRTRLKDEVGLSYSAASAALAYLHLGKADAAQPFVKQTFRLSKKIGSIAGMIVAHGAAGDIAAAQGDAALARNNYRAGLSLDAPPRNPQLRAGLLLRLARLELEHGRYEEALLQYEAAKAASLEAGDPTLGARSFIGVGETLSRMGELAPARQALVCALPFAVRLASEEQLARALLGIARIDQQTGDIARARELARALAHVEFGRAQSLYDELAHALGGERAEPGAGLAHLASALIAESETAALGLS